MLLPVVFSLFQIYVSSNYFDGQQFSLSPVSLCLGAPSAWNVKGSGGKGWCGNCGGLFRLCTLPYPFFLFHNFQSISDCHCSCFEVHIDLGAEGYFNIFSSRTLAILFKPSTPCCSSSCRFFISAVSLVAIFPPENYWVLLDLLPCGSIRLCWLTGRPKESPSFCTLALMYTKNFNAILFWPSISDTSSGRVLGRSSRTFSQRIQQSKALSD